MCENAPTVAQPVLKAHPELLHSLGTFLPHGVHKVPVAVQREGHRIVARVRGNRLGIVPGMDGRHNVGVTEIMKAIVREIGVFQHLIQDLPDRSLGKMAAVRMRENQIRKVPVVPRRSERQFSGSLDGFVPLQHFHQEGGGHDDPPFPVLRRSETESIFERLVFRKCFAYFKL